MPVGNYYSETFFFLHCISLFITFNIHLLANCSEVLFINWTKTWNTTHNIERRPNLRYGSKKFWANSKSIDFSNKILPLNLRFDLWLSWTNVCRNKQCQSHIFLLNYGCVFYCVRPWFFCPWKTDWIDRTHFTLLLR